MKLRFLFLLPLVFLISACASLINSGTPVATIILKPIDSAKADATSLEQARQIIEKRLDYAGITAKVSLENGNISVGIYSSADSENAQKLSTEIGAFAFVDSQESYTAGYKLEPVPTPILTQNDIQSV